MSPQGRTFEVEISDENFTFNKVPIADQRVTGAQIAAAAHAHPLEDFVVLQHLGTGELETLRPTELVDLEDPGVERFFVVKGADLHRFRAAGLSMEWPRASLTADQIVFLAKADPDSEVVLHRGDGPAEIFEGDDPVRIDLPDVEDIKLRPASRKITIKVDGEDYDPPRRRMTPNELIAEAAHLDPASYYLMRTIPKPQVSYKGDGNQTIRLRDGMVFNTVLVGPTTVSDPQFESGPTLFMRGLVAAGFKPTLVPDTIDHVVFDYAVTAGRYGGETIKHGIVVPKDFPMTWPSGPHVSRLVHPNQAGGSHPTGGIHDSDFARLVGGDWQYWSRPYEHHGNLKDPVAAYLTHIWKLWDTQ